MLKSDQPEKKKKIYVIPKVSKKRAAAIASGEWKPKERKPIKKSTTPIANESDNRKRENKVYQPAAKQFVKDNSECQLKLEGCVGVSTAVHHLYSGASRSKYFLVQSTWRATCWHCHHIVHDVMSMEQAIAAGLKLIE
jgi:hypothetical protein